MRRVVLRGLHTRRVRTLLSVISVVLGVALVTGAMTLGGALDDGANKLASSAYDTTDAVVSAPSAFRSQDPGRHDTIPASTLQRVRATPGVGVAAGDILDEAKIIDSDTGTPAGSGPYFGVGLDTRTPGVERLSPFRLVDGRWAAGAGQVVIDRGSAKREHVAVGDRIRIASGGPQRAFTVTGIARFGTVDSLGTASVAIFDLPTAQTMFGKQGRFDDVLVGAAGGASGAAVRTQLSRALRSDSGLEVRTARDHDRFTIISGLQSFVGFIQAFLVAFGFVAVIVGAMTIANALSLTVAQRARELALLRAVGASRGQVLRSVVLEAGVIGGLGSILGLATGVGLAHGLHALVKSFGLDLPSSSLALTGGTVIAATATGLGATLVASLVPALRATHVPPVAAMRDGAAAALPAHRRRRSTIVGGLFTALGAAIVGYGMAAPDLAVGDRLLSFIPGGLALLVGVALLAKYLVVPIASVLGRPSERLGGVAGGLARRNAMRNPQRTAATAAALMVGVALVTCVAVLAAGLKESARKDTTDAIRSSVVVAGTDGWSPVPQGTVAAAAKAPGATTATGIVVEEARAYGNRVLVSGADPGRLAKVWHFDWHRGNDGTLRRLSGDGAIVRRDFAAKHGLDVGSRFAVTTAGAKRMTVTVRGIATGSPLDVLGTGQVTIARPAFDATFPTRRPKLVLVDGASAQSVRQALAAFPDAKVSTTEGFAKANADGIDSITGIVTVLLALAILISVLGIVNTLALGVAERTRELGMLRATGMSRRQVRRMIRHEGALTALVGAGLGIAVGLALAGAVTAALSSQGVRFAIPVGSIAGYAIAAGLAGVLAAAMPARRAARMPVLGALAHE